MAVFNYSQVIRRSIVLITLAVFVQFAFNNYVCANDLLPGVGAVGDSLTDEYSRRSVNYGDDSALCWVDLLAQLRGPTSHVPELTFGDYQMISMGSPRGLGYTYNWALAGTNTATLLSQGQHTGIASQVREGRVQYIAVFIGTNDFQPASSYGMYEAIYNGVTPFTGCDGKSYTSVQDYADSIVERYTIALDAVLDAGGQPVMATIVDFGMAPRTASAQGYSDPDKRHNVTDAVMLVNEGLKSLAATKGLPIVNIFALFHRFVVDPEPSLVGGVSIIKDAAPNPDGRYAILPDGAHPGIVLQGLLANAFIEACNRKYATNFTPLSDQEILGAAGIEYAAGDETFFDITPYVIVPILTKYSGGTGDPKNPYQIATVEDLMLLVESPEDYDKHFILTADIDLDPNLPGRKVFDRAVIAPDTNDDTWSFEGIPFSGVFNGRNHNISNLTIVGQKYIGLFGRLDSGAMIYNLGIETVDVNGIQFVGGLVGENDGSILNCYSKGIIRGGTFTGGLVGSNGMEDEDKLNASIISCYSMGMISGDRHIGGLVGYNDIRCSITASYSTSIVDGVRYIGGLVGENWGDVAASYSTGPISGTKSVGGLVGLNCGSITTSYSTGKVNGNVRVGGLVGYYNAMYYTTSANGSTTASYWDIEASGQTRSAGGTGLATTTMQELNTYIETGWDFVDEIRNGTCDYWQMSPGDYPRLRYYAGNGPVMPEGFGTADEPYLIRDARDLGTVWFEPLANYRLEESLDLSGITWSMAVVPWFKGTFDGNGHIISHLTIEGGSYLGLVGYLDIGAVISNLDLEAVDVNGTGDYFGTWTGDYVGALSGYSKGSVTNCSSTGTVSGDDGVGGLVGVNRGIVAMSYSSGAVSGWGSWRGGVGGLVGTNGNIITESFSNCEVFGSWENAGGLVGTNSGSWSYITASYCTGNISGNKSVGGLVGMNNGGIFTSYSIGMVTGNEDVGGFVGFITENSSNTSCFWDVESSGQSSSAGGTDKTTADMQTTTTFLQAGWDFVGETDNGIEDIWWIDESNDYPRLWWELVPEI